MGPDSIESTREGPAISRARPGHPQNPQKVPLRLATPSFAGFAGPPTVPIWRVCRLLDESP